MRVAPADTPDLTARTRRPPSAPRAHSPPSPLSVRDTVRPALPARLPARADDAPVDSRASSTPHNSVAVLHRSPQALLVFALPALQTVDGCNSIARLRQSRSTPLTVAAARHSTAKVCDAIALLVPQLRLPEIGRA